VRRASVVAIALVVLCLAACSGDGVIKIRDPGPVPNLTTTTALDFGQIGLKGVSSRTTTSIGLGPGGASLAGTVAGPDGAVEGATVHVERFVGNSSGTADVQTAPDGTWTVPAVLGGRYRVRAWRAPDLALTKPEVFYLQSSENKTLNLRVDRYTGIGATASIAPDPPLYGQPANLFVLVTQKSVDSSGVVRGAAVPSTAVELGGTGYSLETGNPQVTDANGVAQWRVRCQYATTQQLSVTFTNGASAPLQVAPCVDASGSTTPPSSTTSTTITRRTTTTSRRGL
jgi:hypothetical protein